MHHPERTRYFQLRQRLSLHTRRLGILILGTLLSGILVVRTTAQTPTTDNQTLFRPFAPLSFPPTAEPRGMTDSQGTPVPTLTQDPLAAEALVPLPTPAIAPVLYDDWRFTSEPGLSVAAIQAILDAYPGPLKSTLVTVGDRNMSIAEVIAGQAYLYSLNPKLILALLEYEQGLLTNPNPSDEQLTWAMNFRGEDEQWKGLSAQIRWSARELRRGARDYIYATELEYKPEIIKNDDDEEEQQRPVRGPIPQGLNPASYAIIRTLAQTRSPQEIEQLVANGSFIQTYTNLFGDPRTPLTELPAPAAPFLRSPLPKPIYITSFFDHEYPFLVPNGSLVSWLGRRETAISYDGHDGWDYGLRPPDPILSAAAGTVVWAGNSDDGCYTPAKGVVIDHGNGYRTLYWHLSEIQVELGQAIEAGQQLGIVGASGCAFGPHLHFQTQYVGRNVNPYGWCSSESDPWAAHPIGAPSYWLWADRLNPCNLPDNVVVVGPGSPNFSTSGSGWQSAPVGVHGESFWIESQVAITQTDNLTRTISELADVVEPVPTTDSENPPPPPATARWEPNLPAAGTYRVLGYIPYYYNGLEDAGAVKYRIHHANGSSDVVINQFLYANGWIDFGTYTFDPAQPAYVEVSNETLAPKQAVWVGALVWQPVQ